MPLQGCNFQSNQWRCCKQGTAIWFSEAVNMYVSSSLLFFNTNLVLYLIQMMTTRPSFEKCLILSLRHFKAILSREMGGQRLVRVRLAALFPVVHLESQIPKITLFFECVFPSSDTWGIWSNLICAHKPWMTDCKKKNGNQFYKL